MKKNIPNILTSFRILIIPILVLSFYIPSLGANLIAASLFLVAGITDFFDGYFARSMKAESNFGKCLDPIADKLLVVVAITMLIHFSDKNLLITLSGLIIICREILVSGMREFLASLNVSVPVSKLAKWKTAVQMTSITLLLLGKQGSVYAVNEILGEKEAKNIKLIIADIVTNTGEFLFVVAAILTVITGYIYLKIGFKNM